MMNAVLEVRDESGRMLSSILLVDVEIMDERIEQVWEEVCERYMPDGELGDGGLTGDVYYEAAEKEPTS